MNGVNTKLLYSYLDEYFSCHNELENYQVVLIIMKLIHHEFTPQKQEQLPKIESEVK